MEIEYRYILYSKIATRPFKKKDDGSIEYHTYPNEEIPVRPQTKISIYDKQEDKHLSVSAFEGYDVFTLIKLGAITSYFHRAEKAMYEINSIVSEKSFPRNDIVRVTLCRIRKYIENRTPQVQSMDKNIKSLLEWLESEVSFWGDALVRNYNMRSKFIAHFDEKSPSHEIALEDNYLSNLSDDSPIWAGPFVGGNSPHDDFKDIFTRSLFFYEHFAVWYDWILILEREIERCYSESNE